MSANVDPYLALITSEHNQRPKYVQAVSVSVQPFADLIDVVAALPTDFDLDVAIGVQLDAVGVRVGRTRFLTTPLDVFFSFNVAGLGWNEGVWKGTFDSASGLTRLYDDAYRILLRAVIAANNWDGTVPGAYAAWNALFAGTGFGILVQDYGNMTMAIALIGNQPDAVTKALFTTGELDLKPAAMGMFHILPTVYPAGRVDDLVGTPLFGFGVENENIAGFGVGAWANFSSVE